MSWDVPADLREATQSARTDMSGTDPRVLHPFRSLLTGSVLVAGGATADLVAALRETARSVTILKARADQSRYDAVVLLHPTTSALDGLGVPPGEGEADSARRCPPDSGAGTDRLTQALDRAAGLLRPGGQLVVVVANASSLRHLTGHSEADATLDPVGFADRAHPDGSALPTRRGLRDRLARLGLTQQAWWFPFPDHRLALSLVGERGLDAGGPFEPGLLAAAAAPFDPDGPGPGGRSLQRAWAAVARAELLGDLAPAFAVAASVSTLPEDPRLALHFGHRRRPAFDKVVGFVRVGDAIRVTRAPLHADLPRTVDGVTNRFPDEPFVPGVPWQAGLQALLAHDGWTVAGIVAWASVWRDAVRAHYADGADLTLGTPLPGEAVDAIPRNLLHRGGVPVFIDAEWEVEALCFGHLLVRGLINAFTDVEVCGSPAPGISPTLLPLVLAVAEGLGITLDAAALDEALARENRFQTAVSGIETRRNRAWLGATSLPLRTGPPDPFAERDRALAHLHREVAALRADGDRRVAAVTEDLEESRRRTDRVVRYAAELDRERGRLAHALAAAHSAMQGQSPSPEEAGARRGAFHRRGRPALAAVVWTVLATGLGRLAFRRSDARR